MEDLGCEDYGGVWRPSLAERLASSASQALQATRKGGAPPTEISDRGAGVARGACVTGSGWWGAGAAKHAGQVARGVPAAGCRGSAFAKWRAVRGGGRWCRRKAAAFESGAWAAGGEAPGVTASGQAGEACWWHAAWERARLARGAFLKFADQWFLNLTGDKACRLDIVSMLPTLFPVR